MKTKSIKITIGLLLFVLGSMAQNNLPIKPIKKTITVLNIDSKGLALDPQQMGNLVRIELEKLDTFEVMDRYDVNYLIDKNKLNISNCYGKLCLVEIGDIIKSEKMFTGSIELYGESIIITLRIIDVASAKVEKTEVKEFLNFPKELQSMIQISVRELFNMRNDDVTLTRLTKPFNYETSTNNPNQSRLNLSGSRMGFTVFTGQTAKYLKASKKEGGFEAFPMMFQFGYQFEKQYLNEGNFQALFEFVPLITGLDQALFIPSLTVMNGLRDNRHGWEFAFGPSINLEQKANRFKDENGDWQSMKSRIDSRGKLALNTGFVLAVGRTFKSGKLNIPVNAYVVPNKDGWRFGVSFGYNSKNK